MPLRPLTLDAVEAGNLVEQINHALDLIGRDVVERYTIQKARSVVVTIEINPGSAVQSADGQRRLYPEIDWKVSHRVPGASGMTTRAFVENLHGRQVLAVNTNDPGGIDPNQQTIFDQLPVETEEPH